MQHAARLVDGEYGQDGPAILAKHIDPTTHLSFTNHAMQAHRLESVGRLAGGIAHDVNNILTVVAGAADILHRRSADEPGAQTVVQMLKNSADRGKTLVDRLLAFTQAQDLKPEPLDLNAVTAALVADTYERYGEAVRTTHPPASAPLIAFADRAALYASVR